MMGSVVLPGTRREEWPRMRAGIAQRVAESLGREPDAATGEPVFEEVERYEKHALVHVRLRYRVLGDEWNEAVCVFPPGGEAALPAPAVLTVHGTNGAVGKYGMLDPDGTPARAYGIELARRGYVTVSADQFGFGASAEGSSEDALTRRFYQRYPEWSIVGRRVFEQKRVMDVVQTLGWARGRSFGAMGNSLGGGLVVFLAAFDERIAAAAPSCGISPNVSNVFRYITRHAALMPTLSAAITQTGRMPWDYHELLALCAPRALLAFEPYNDTEGCNPDVGTTIECLNRAAQVYRLLGHPERLAFMIHGDGHDTPPDVREMAYRWFDRFLRPAG